MAWAVPLAPKFVAQSRDPPNYVDQTEKILSENRKAVERYPYPFLVLSVLLLVMPWVRLVLLGRLRDREKLNAAPFEPGNDTEEARRGEGRRSQTRGA